jgi:hypothetical protein
MLPYWFPKTDELKKKLYVQFKQKIVTFAIVKY